MELDPSASRSRSGRSRLGSVHPPLRSACWRTGRSGAASRYPFSSPPSCWPRSRSPRGGALLDGKVLVAGLAVAVLGSVLPFALELGALRQISAATFGIILSLEPAVAAFAGAVALAQVPSAIEASRSSS